jgi:uncharacterized protein YukE
VGVGNWLRNKLPADFWDKIDEIDFVKRHYGIPGPELRPLLEQFSLIDSDALRQAAEFGWGVGGDRAGVPANTATEIHPAVQRLIGSVAERWHGEAFDSFSSTTSRLSELLPKLTAPCQEVGQQLVAIADAFEMTWLEILGWTATGIAVAATVITIIDMVPGDEIVAGGALAIIAAVLGAISTIISVYVTFVGSTSRFGTLEELITTIEQTLDELPRVDDAPVPALPAGKWVRDSADPVS